MATNNLLGFRLKGLLLENRGGILARLRGMSIELLFSSRRDIPER